MQMDAELRSNRGRQRRN